MGLQEACGVFGIYAPGEDVARLTYFGLYALQHRGQESAGIATADGQRVRAVRRMGLVAQVFSEDDLQRLTGHIAIGHTRYSTTGSSLLANAQPMLVESDLGSLAAGHNGNIVNTTFLYEELASRGEVTTSSTDSEIIARLCATASGRDWVERLQRTLPMVQGAYSMTMLTATQLIGVRDPLGVRPLCLGRLGEGWVLASESCALDTIGATVERDLEPGEILVVDALGIRSDRIPKRGPRATCVFEYVYFARPDSVLDNRLVYTARERMGRILAREHPVVADLVMPIPDASVPAAIGFARESGIPYREGLIKNRYIGRTFIQPDQRLRDDGVRLKFNPLPEVIRGKRAVVVDDSIVRGTTTPRVVEMIRRAGATEVHVRVTAPPMRHPCYLGLDTSRREELIASRMNEDDICKLIGADSLGYLSMGGLLEAVDLPQSRLCSACFTGNYPIPVQLEMDKLVLERR